MLNSNYGIQGQQAINRMPFNRSFRRYIFCAVVLLLNYQHLPAQIFCETGYFSEYTASGHLLPASITSLKNGQQIIAGKANLTPADRQQGFAARISETGDVLWSYIMDAGEGGVLYGMLEKANGEYIFYGNLYSAADPDGKIWLLCLNAAGALQWSRVFESGQVGIERIFSLIELPDGDLLGAFNIADSTATSRPLVFRLGDDGTIRWAREYAQSGAVAFNCMSYYQGKIYAGGFQQTENKNALIMILDPATGNIEERRYPSHLDDSYEQEAAFVQVFNNRITYFIRYRKWRWDGALMYGTILVQGKPDNSLFYDIQQTGLEPTGRQVQMKRNQTNDFVILKNSNNQSAMLSYSHFNRINWSRILSPSINLGYDYVGFDTTVGGGGISVAHEVNYDVNSRTRMKVSRLTASGSSGNCFGNGYTFSGNTVPIQHKTIDWVGTPMHVSLNMQQSPVLVQTVLTLQGSKTCSTSICKDLTPLDPGCNKTMMVEYSTSARSQLTDAVSLSDGSRIAVGHNNFHPWIMKLKENGDIAWSRIYESYNSISNFKRVIRLSSNTLLIAGNRTVEAAYNVGKRNLLVKIDNNGNVLASHLLYSGRSSEVSDLIATEDGGFLLIETSIDGFPPIYSFVTRFDKNMQIVWKKRILSSDAFFRSAYISDQKIYFAHDYNSSPWRKRGGVSRMDFATGNMEWSSSFEFTDPNATARVNRIYTVKDTVYGFFNLQFDIISKLCMVRMNSQGQIIDFRSVGEHNIRNPYPISSDEVSRPTVTLTPDLDFVTGNKVLTASGEVLNLSRFNRAAEPVWSRNYLQYKDNVVFNIRPHAGGFQLVGKSIRNEGEDDQYFSHAFLMKTDSAGKITLSNTGDCAPVNSPFSSNAINFIEIDGWISGEEENTSLIIEPVNLALTDVPTDAMLACHRVSDCNPVTLAMSGDICQLNQPIRFYLENNTCGAKATWTYDQDQFQELRRNGDTLVLLPKRSGASRILAGVEDDCTFRELSQDISIAVMASSLNLGADTVICANKTLILKAGTGFQSYSWSNGSSDAELEVTQPGEYHVQVTDHCGGTRRDTILVQNPQEWFSVSGPLQKCNTDTILLKVPDAFSQVTWASASYLQANGHTALVYPLQTAEVSVQAEWLPGCVVNETVQINVLHSPTIDLGMSRDICYNESIALTVPAGFDSYNWSTGETGNEIVVSNEGVYHVSAVYTNGCFSYDTVQIRKRPFNAPDLGSDMSICENKPAQISPGNYADYLWSTGSIADKLQVSATGTYWVRVTDAFGCKGTDTIRILTMLKPPANFLPVQLAFCPGQELSINPSGNYSQYEWSTGSTSSFIKVKDTSTYMLQVVGLNGCVGKDTVHVQFKSDCPQSIYFPKAFTPNNDGLNDGFAPVIYGLVTNYQLAIYNRWGQVVFRSSTPGQVWDGRYLGTLQNGDVFVWKCRYQFPGKPVQNQSGTFTLVR